MISIFVIFPALAIALIGFLGNCLVVTVIRKKQLLRTTTNILLANVALADIITLVFLPFLLFQEPILRLRPEGIFADLLCKLLMDYNVPVTARTASILTLTVVSVERYHAIAKPMREGVRLRKDNVRYAIIAVWIIAIGMTLPPYYYGYHSDIGDDNICRHEYPNPFLIIYAVSILVSVFLFSALVIVFCYFQILKELYFKKPVAPQNTALAQEDKRSKRKLVKVSMSIVIATTACLLPFVITGVLNQMHLSMYNMFNVCSGIFYLQCSINPFLYAYQSSNFRQAFKEIIKSCV